MSKSVVITGISSGIGYHLAKVYSETGYQVFGSVRSEEDYQRISKEIPDVVLLKFDVLDTQAIVESVKTVEAALNGKGLDILINNAGVVVSGPLMLLEVEDFQKQYDINLFGMLRVTQAFLPLLGAVDSPSHKPGMIINMSSVTGQLAFPFVGAYCSSKSAIESFSHSLRRELLPFGIKVVIVAPSGVKTPIWSKESTTQIPQKVAESIFGSYFSHFQHHMQAMARKGLDADKLARKIARISEKRSPKTRYAFAKQYLVEWLIPRYLLPDKIMDKILKKLMSKS